MSKNEQVMVLEPSSELRFRGPFTDVVSSNLKLTNPTDKKICFKIKTTAPRRYCVRPNSGIVDPNSSVNVSVMLQPFEYDPNEKNKHKFMVQTMFAPPGDIDQETIWKDASGSDLMDSKLKCVFELPVDSQQQGGKDTQTKPNIKPTEARVQSPAKASNMSEADYRRVMEECKRLQSEVNHLKQENNVLRDDGVRQRRTASADEDSYNPHVVKQQQQQASGFPPVLYLVLAVFFGIVLGKFVL
ncbi:vesicle-associated membrane protein-associated protein A-like isoform X2 [Ptychodera flava]|uniref:vesicle-associated membrane protein-associated protein A-like isoform X2 n=1 Tax=Ptychodera flava TaxID=63121 RepID=UPI00396A820C